MASNLPTFESTAQLEPGPVVSKAAGSEAASRFGDEVANVAQSFGKKKLEDFDVAKGEIAGLNPNFSPEAGFGPEEQAFNNAALATNKQMIGNDIASHSNNLLRIAAQNPDAQAGLAEYTQGMQAYGIATVKNVPFANEASTKELLKYHTGSGQLNLQKNVDKQNKIVSGIAYENTAQSRHDSLISAINSSNGDLHNPDGTLTAGGQAVGQIVNSSINANEIAARAGTINLKEMVSANKNVRDTAQENTLLAQHSAALTHGTEPEFLKSFEANKTIGSQQKEKYFNEMMSQKSQFLQAQGVSKSTVQKNLTSMIAGVYKGGKINQRVLTQYGMVYPALEAKAEQDAQDAETGFSVVKAAIHLSPAQQQQYIDARLKPTGNEPSGTFNRKLNLYQHVNTQVSNINNEMKNDIVGFAQKHPFLIGSSAQQQSQEDVNAPAEAANSPDAPVRTVPVNTIQRMVDMQRTQGRPENQIQVMSKSVAQLTAAQMTSLPPNQLHEYLNQKLPAQYGQNTNFAISQLKREGVPQGLFWLGAMKQTDPTYETAVAAYSTPTKVLNANLDPSELKILKETADANITDEAQSGLQNSGFLTGFFGRLRQAGEAVENIDPTGNNVTNYIKSINSYKSSSAPGTSSVASTIANLHSHALRIGKQILSTQGGSVNDAINRGVETVTNQFNYPKINGATVNIPKQFNNASVIAYAKEMQKNRLALFPFKVDKNNAQTLNVKDINGPSEKVLGWLSRAVSDLAGETASGIGGPSDTLGDLFDKAYKTGDLKMSPRQLYYNKEVQGGHWSSKHDNTGLIYIQQNGVPLHTAAGKNFEFSYEDAQNNMPADFGSPTYYLRQGLKYANAKSSDLVKLGANPTFSGAEQVFGGGNK